MNYRDFTLGDWIGHISGAIEDETTLDGNEMRDLVEFLTTIQEPKTISIPEGATNGDAFKIMFNKTFPKTIILYKNDESRLTINPMFSREWWEMPYKESEVNNGD